MATYTGQRIKDTYESILKLEDNENLTSSTKKVTDGLGNQTPLSISSTEVKSSSDIEASGFKTPSGTSSEFLMADGSVSSSGSVDLSDYLKNNEDDTTTGTLTASGLTVSKESSGVDSNKLTFQSQAGGSSNISEGNIYTYSGSDYNVGMVFGTQAKDDSGNEFVLPSFRINDSDNDVTFYHGIEVTDGVKIVSGTSSQFLKADGSVDANTYLTSYTDTNTQLTDEQVQDIIGGMVSSNAESNITVTYDDVNGKLNFASTDTNTQLTTEQVQDVVGGMWIDGVNTAVTYNDTNGTISIVSTDTNTQRTDSEINTLIGNYTDAKYLRSNADDTTSGNLTIQGNTKSKDLILTNNASNQSLLEFNVNVGGGSNTTKAHIYSYSGTDYDAALMFGTQSKSDSGNEFILPSFRINDSDNDVYFYHGIEVVDSIKLSGGTSSEFLKADGSVDTNTYLTSYTDTQRTDEEIRDVASAQWIDGSNTTVVKDDASNTIKINSVNTDTNTQRTDAEINTLIGNYTDAKYLRSNADDTTTGTLTSKGLIVSKDLSSNEGKIEFQASPSSSSNVSKASIYAYAGSDYDTGLVFGTQSITDSGNQFVLPSFRINDVDNDVIFYHGIEVADAVKIVGGTSSQFLKADGTLDNSTYLTSYTDTNTQRSDEEIRDVASAQWVNGTNTTVVKDDGANTIKINSLNTNTQLSTEQVQDIVGGMVSSNTETNIAVTYNDSTGKLNFASTDTNTNTQLSTEQVQDIVGGMVSSNTETNIAVTYNDSTGKLNFVSTDTNTNTQRSNEEIRDIASAQWVNGTNTTVVKDDGANTIKINSVNTNTQRSDSEINTLIGNYTDAKYLRSNTSDTMTGDLTVTGETRVQGSGSSSFVGRVGIGTTTPDHMLELEGAAPFIYITDTTETESGIIFRDSQAQGSQAAAIKFSSSDNKLRFYNNDTLAKRMVIDTTGRVGIGTDSPLATLHIDNPQTASNNIGFISDAAAGGLGSINMKVNLPNYGEGIRFLRTGSYNKTAMKFFNNTTPVGSVAINTSSTSYNTTSDYRLKENIVPMENSINRLNKLKPCRFNFLIDVESVVDGFIAHEAQEVVPESVTGEKDELNFEGKPEYQSIDHSKLVPLLTSALQEAISKIDQLETRIQNLEELIN